VVLLLVSVQQPMVNKLAVSAHQTSKAAAMVLVVVME
jgi:hypothetical protein